MSIPSATALKNRARLLLEAMHERGRWVYAIPQDTSEAAREVVLAEGLSSAENGVFRGDNGACLRLLEDPELEVILLIAETPEAVATLSKVLDRVGFFAQSQLLAVAYDVDDEEAPAALRTLAYMISGWGEPWVELFDLHLRATASAVRIHAAHSLLIAANHAPEVPARSVLERCLERETTPEVQEALRLAIAG